MTRRVRESDLHFGNVTLSQVVWLGEGKSRVRCDLREVPIEDLVGGLERGCGRTWYEMLGAEG